jgi:hypothetical protein
MRKVIAATLIAGAIAAPASVLASNPDHPAKRAHPAKKKPVVSMVFRGVVAVDAVSGEVAITPMLRGSNRHARRVLDGASEMTVTIGDKTKLRGFIINADGKRVFTAETIDDLNAGDRVRFVIRARKGTPLAELPAVRWMKDFTGLVAPADEPPTDPPADEPAPTEGTGEVTL